MVEDVGKPLDGQQTRSPDPKLAVGNRRSSLTYSLDYPPKIQEVVASVATGSAGDGALDECCLESVKSPVTFPYSTQPDD